MRLRPLNKDSQGLGEPGLYWIFVGYKFQYDMKWRAKSKKTNAYDGKGNGNEFIKLSNKLKGVCSSGSDGPHRQACTTTMSLFRWALWRIVSWTSPKGNWLSAEPLGGKKKRRRKHQSRSALLPDWAAEARWLQHVEQNAPEGYRKGTGEMKLIES